jgi:hypothetical protein
MSSESRTDADTTVREECTACGTALQERLLALQSYPESREAEIAGLSAGGVLYCPECAAEPVELLDSWDDHDRPPVDADRPIGAGYHEVADQCSFCTDELDSAAVVGIELYRRPEERLPAYANYTLCADCRGVFEKFSENVSEGQ